MSNRLFQGVVHQMRDAIDRTIGVIDETSAIIACSDLDRKGKHGRACRKIVNSVHNLFPPENNLSYSMYFCIQK